ncbi:MAG: hypothetical protein KY440_10175, partial [Actinobacteria bacterium]|nr:hypothetical protein [Actinomycetota bacterium]
SRSDERDLLAVHELVVRVPGAVLLAGSAVDVLPPGKAASSSMSSSPPLPMTCSALLDATMVSLPSVPRHVPPLQAMASPATLLVRLTASVPF